MVRFPKEALDYGIDQLAKCFEGVGSGLVKVVHLCCGYPNHLVSQAISLSIVWAFLNNGSLNRKQVGCNNF